jgi:diguanylate cyclase (GGDEF)-like protein/PAS domain S-box-containing protein
MSHALEPLDGRPVRNENPHPKGTRQPELCLDDLTHGFNQIALDMVTESIVLFSAPTTRLIHVNRAACECLGFSQTQLRRMSLLDIAPHANSGTLAEMIRRAMRKATQHERVQTVYRHRGGWLIPVHCSIRALRTFPESLLLAVGQEISTQNCSNPPSVHATFRDSLTLLPNRGWLWRQLECEVLAARRGDYQFAVLFVDIDRFKDINDSFGHLAGDQVLQAVARRLKNNVRTNDDVARYGGDEFVVLLRDVKNAEDICRVVANFGRHVNASGKCPGGEDWRTRVTFSIGVAICGGTGSSAAEAIERADRAMYRAKALGRNGRFVIDESPKDSAQNTGVCSEVAGRIRQFE